MRATPIHFRKLSISTPKAQSVLRPLRHGITHSIVPWLHSKSARPASSVHLSPILYQTQQVMLQNVKRNQKQMEEVCIFRNLCNLIDWYLMLQSQESQPVPLPPNMSYRNTLASPTQHVSLECPTSPELVAWAQVVTGPKNAKNYMDPGVWDTWAGWFRHVSDRSHPEIQQSESKWHCRVQQPSRAIAHHRRVFFICLATKPSIHLGKRVSNSLERANK